ncbi:divergent PAP2 family protein [Caldicellulosiruptor changbaiensis]|uniref:Divergent PAP2 family protein n=1 Tax=Caldicellulosiruptor changbaiensis TaxID=1222016 RepID=A0A3T0D5R7_9FIRM|nr:divergent PAP2 family protein [Caldicellulosiruptor changbaiensis]AZT90420.1 divergent PAP2 family protein [Caldicellulosiruptor changbaiensis]
MKQVIYEIFTNRALQVGFVSWFIAQCLKIIITFFVTHQIDFKKFISSGGMPSSHSAFACGLSTAVGFIDGFSSTSFAISLTFTLIVMYDAAGVRREAGKQAQTLNELIEMYFSPHYKPQHKLKELIGHKPTEVFVGALLGILIATIMI